MEINNIVQEYREIKDDYAYNPDMMSDEDERVRKVKYIIDTKLSVADKTIIILYAQYRSYRKLGKRMGLSHMTMRNECIRIRKIILKEYERLH